MLALFTSIIDTLMELVLINCMFAIDKILHMFLTRRFSGLCILYSVLIIL